jgi:glycosyltransferase involved in cell wall biosynthesis
VVVGGPFAIGNSDYYDLCKNEAIGCSNIHFTGWLKAGSDELSSAFCNAQALILPSFKETFGLVAVEAAMAGSHVCLSNSLPILDFNVFDKSLTFNPRSVEQIRNVIIDVMNREKDSVVKDSVKSVFSWDRIISQHIELYTK